MFQRRDNGTRFLMTAIGRRFLAECCCEGAPLSCPCADDGSWDDLADGTVSECSGLTRCYKIDDYVDGDITCESGSPCSTQSYDSDYVWDGTFQALDVIGGCFWDGLWEEGVGEETMVDGYPMSNIEISLTSKGSPTIYGWWLNMECDPGTSANRFWIGYKTSGDSPAGIYQRYAFVPDNCVQTPTTISIVEDTCP
jgi:hypothetical protein